MQREILRDVFKFTATLMFFAEKKGNAKRNGQEDV